MDDEMEQPKENIGEAVAGAEPSESSDSELIALQEKLAEIEAKSAENLDGWQRAQAEFANYKKRVARDAEQMGADARVRVLKRYLEVLDDLDLALKNKPQDGEGAEWSKGIELIYRKLNGFLESEGLTKLDPLGEMFDANLHEAVTEEDSAEYDSGVITEVLRPGYMLGERVLRPAAVKVAK
ncbi:MAG: nucleotide exchange factor GrpE [Anaerolineales bacterium]